MTLFFFDADNDGDQDLYVVSGGYEFSADDTLLQDRLYLNNGQGKLIKGILPVNLVSSSCVRPADFDRDGDVDLFVGGRIIPEKYPECPESFILMNDGHGTFSKNKHIAELDRIGMVTDALWNDVNKDGFDDLIVVGEWMGVEVFLGDHGTLRKQTEKLISRQASGWWNCIVGGDFDGDGDQDFILGNAGLNNQIKASNERPASLVFGDIDGNGSVDPLMSYYAKGKNYPYASRDEITEQLPIFRKKFRNYASYSETLFDQILTPEQTAVTKRLDMNQMQSCYLRNDDGRLSFLPLPREAQIAPILSIVVSDVNKDGKLDFVSVGNLSGTRSRSGKMTGNPGSVFIGDGKGEFVCVTPLQTGLRIVGDARHMVCDGNRIIIGVNNSLSQVYEIVDSSEKK